MNFAVFQRVLADVAKQVLQHAPELPAVRHDICRLFFHIPAGRQSFFLKPILKFPVRLIKHALHLKPHHMKLHIA